VYITPSASLTPIPVTNTLNINIPTGGTMAFYITLRGTNYVAYTNGRAQGTTMKSKSGLEFKEGWVLHSEHLHPPVSGMV
jgi:hypothetical protein